MNIKEIIKALDLFTLEYGFKAGYLFSKKGITDPIEKKCMSIIVYALYKVYDIKTGEVCKIVNRSKNLVYVYTKEVQEDFDYNEGKEFNKMFEDLLGILEAEIQVN